VQAQVPIVPFDTCKTDYAPVSRLTITENQICAGTGAVDTCAGDSGGPMLSDQVRMVEDLVRLEVLLIRLGKNQ
jgi:secreted trypsin-like serine protease